MSTNIGEWLARDLFDDLPEGVPALDPEDDDEDQTKEEVLANLPKDGTPVYYDGALYAAGGWCAPSENVYAPPGMDTSTTVWLYAIPENDVDLPGPEDPKHATLLFLGHIGGDGSPALGDYQSLLANVANIAAKNHPRFTAKVTGIEQLGDDGAQVWMLDSPDLAALHDDLLEIDSEVASLYEDGTFTKYPEFKPHVTIGYPDDLATEDIEEAQSVTEITFDRIALGFAEQTIEFPLGGGQ